MFLTAFAMSHGILEVEMYDLQTYQEGSYVSLPGYEAQLFMCGEDVFMERADAEKEAERERVKNIKYHETQLGKLMSMNFSPKIQGVEAKK